MTFYLSIGNGRWPRTASLACSSCTVSYYSKSIERPVVAVVLAAFMALSSVRSFVRWLRGGTSDT